MQDNAPALFGLNNSNRDFGVSSDWGKNVFNNAFPVSLVSYMQSTNRAIVYLKLTSDFRVEHSKISAGDIFGLEPSSPKLFYDFEGLYLPYEPLVSSNLPRIDLVTCEYNGELLDHCIRPIEIKLTALPDNSTAGLGEENYGSEMVVRPDTIVYLALAIASNYLKDRQKIASILLPVTSSISGWNDPIEIAGKISEIKDAIEHILLDSIEKQKPYLLQPIWKTNGKTLELEEHCLDSYIWSDYGFTRLFIDTMIRTLGRESINRPMRSCIWLAKMLHDFATDGKINHSRTIRDITFGWQTDKAFAVSGRITRNYLKGPELIKPRVRVDEIKNIILNGGEKMLSPERRFDAAVSSNASLFE